MEHMGEDFQTYAHINEKRRRHPMRRFEGADINDKLIEIFELEKRAISSLKCMPNPSKT
jgi:hypothetical protein